MRETMRGILVFLIPLATVSAGSGAVIVWDFNPANTNGSVGSSTESIHGSLTGLNPLDPTTPLVTVSGFNADNTPHTLYWKHQGTDEHGIGLTGTNDNELTLKNNGTAIANYIQIDVTGVLLAGYTNMLIRVQSATSGEKFDVWGSSTPNSFTTRLISGSIANNTFIPVPLDINHYNNYYLVTVTPQSGRSSDNVLPDAVSFELSNPVPEPAALLPAALGALAAMRGARTRTAPRCEAGVSL